LAKIHSRQENMYALSILKTILLIFEDGLRITYKLGKNKIP